MAFPFAELDSLNVSLENMFVYGVIDLFPTTLMICSSSFFCCFIFIDVFV